jgi:shikimate kinase
MWEGSFTPFRFYASPLSRFYKSMNKSNIVLIGMPGSGKSTVGIILAKRLSYGFLDTDVMIQISEKRSLQAIVDSDGYMALRKIEENVILSLKCQRQVIATGGSAVYSPAAMDHLKKQGIVVFLDAPIHTLLSRINDMDTRGIARRPDQSFEDLFKERFALYVKYAEITVASAGLSQEEVCDAVIEKIG